jgi:GDPmannose 4,6-dehydratase
MFICNGILFNHESPLRSLDFVTRKISNAVARISLGLDHELKIGNIDSRRDWGYAPEYVEAAWRMLQQNEPGDYVIATNETHTVKDFMKKAFSIAGLDWTKYVRIDRSLFRPSDVTFLRGDYSKAKDKLGWQPEVKFDRLVEIMVKADIEGWQKWSRGEMFPWDAPAYPS